MNEDIERLLVFEGTDSTNRSDSEALLVVMRYITDYKEAKLDQTGVNELRILMKERIERTNLPLSLKGYLLENICRRELKADKIWNIFVHMIQFELDIYEILDLAFIGTVAVGSHKISNIKYDVILRKLIAYTHIHRKIDSQKYKDLFHRVEYHKRQTQIYLNEMLQLIDHYYCVHSFGLVCYMLAMTVLGFPTSKIVTPINNQLLNNTVVV